MPKEVKKSRKEFWQEIRRITDEFADNVRSISDSVEKKKNIDKEEARLREIEKIKSDIEKLK